MPVLHRAAWLLPIVRPPLRDGWVLVDRGQIVALGGPHDPIPGTQGPGTQGPRTEGPRTEGPGTQGPGTQGPGTQGPRTQGPGTQGPRTQGPRTEGPGTRDPWAQGPRTEGPGTRDPWAVLPGLVNAHAHLELSWMRGRTAVQPAASMPAWVSKMLALRRTVACDVPEPIVDAVSEMRATGTALVGDVTNTLAAWDAIADSHLSAFIFREVLGFNAADPEGLVAAARAEIDALPPLAWIRGAVAPHAPYSVSPDLFRAIGASAGEYPLSVHLGESREEIEFLRLGTGAWRLMLEQVGAWSGTWPAPGCGPVEYLDQFGLVNDRLLAVHAVQLVDAELERLAEARATVVTCPRSNRWTGAGTPPIDRFYSSGVRVAIGTDSLASVEDLNMFAELAAIRRLVPAAPASRILRSATLDGAEALGFAGELGSIEPGKRAELIAVRVPPGIEDVEEYLLSGITAANVRWLDPAWYTPAGRTTCSD